jgi:hypothetical protein
LLDQKKKEVWVSESEKIIPRKQNYESGEWEENQFMG